MQLLAADKHQRALFVTAIATGLLAQAATLPLGGMLVVTFNPPMPLWFYTYYGLILIVSFPIGFAAALFGRWMRRFVAQSPALPLATACTIASAQYVTIAYLKYYVASLPMFVEICFLILWTCTTPFFLGTSLYLFLCHKHLLRRIRLRYDSLK